MILLKYALLKSTFKKYKSTKNKSIFDLYKRKARVLIINQLVQGYNEFLYYSIK